ncbi:GNAT family N-acetyltransferase [Kitasatospora sp. NBC_01250]|uniref:GNAT family N-acetyltransferase n=1 Tax=unclassified Kitasatospora TaxID=2633591 RepID=UPI002E158DFF|nr:MULTISPECIES: GNAT family N-acetyltransferase [unclassified Kitasatospora]WSJ69208.1 GNAT family N-acetyltransferase [Kitasatospora sp. NBC_01302]
MNQDIRIRPIHDGDWDAIVALEAATYTDGELSEERAALESRGRVAPGTSFVLERERRLLGYVLALPYPVDRYPDLSRAEHRAHRSRNLHLHDLVIAPGARGRRLGTRLLAHLTATAAAKGYERISLVAVGGAHTFWAAHGFAAHPGIALPTGYGPDAHYMSSTVPEHPSGTVPGHRSEESKPVSDLSPGSPSEDEVG